MAGAYVSDPFYQPQPPQKCTTPALVSSRRTVHFILCSAGHKMDGSLARWILPTRRCLPSVISGTPHVSVGSTTSTETPSGSAGWVAGELPSSVYVMLARVSIEPPTLSQSQASITYVISRTDSSRLAICHVRVDPSQGTRGTRSCGWGEIACFRLHKCYTLGIVL